MWKYLAMRVPYCLTLFVSCCSEICLLGDESLPLLQEEKGIKTPVHLLRYKKLNTKWETTNFLLAGIHHGTHSSVHTYAKLGLKVMTHTVCSSVLQCEKDLQQNNLR